MAVMEFLSRNLFNTTTEITVQSNTNATQYLFDRHHELKYITVGYTTNTSTQITINFGTNTVISHLLLINHNLKDFTAYYNNTTTNLFTPNINVSGNSQTSSYLAFNSVTVTAVTLNITGAMTVDTERAIGELVLANRQLQFARNPNIGDFKPTLFRKQVKHEMPDGGISLYNIRDKYKANIGFKFISDAFRNNLYTIFTTYQPFYFLPYPTTTSWDGISYEVVWTGEFNFNYADNVKSNGWNGEIMLEQSAGV